MGTTSRCVKVKLNDVDVQMEANSGADVNIMDEHKFKAFVHRSSDRERVIGRNTMKHWVQYSKELKTRGLLLTSPSAILVRPRLHFMVIDLTKKASSRPQRRYKLFTNVNPPGQSPR